MPEGEENNDVPMTAFTFIACGSDGMESGCDVMIEMVWLVLNGLNRSNEWYNACT